MATVTMFAPVPYLGSYRLGRSPKEISGTFYRMMPLQVEVVDPAHAPVAFSLPREDGSTVRWREVDGRLMREVLGPDEAPAPLTRDFVREVFLAEMRICLTLHGRINDWRDYPFAIRAPAQADFAWVEDAARLEEKGDGDRPFGAWIRDGAPEAHARASRIAAGLVVCDGILMREAPPPVLRVSLREDATERLASVRIEHCIPEIDDWWGGVAFPHDLEDVARDCAERMVDWHRRWAEAQGQVAPAVTIERDERVLEVHPHALRLTGAELLPEGRRAWPFLRQFHENMQYGIGDTKAKMAAPRLLGVYAAIAEAVAAGPGDEAACQAGLAAVRRLREGVTRAEPWAHEVTSGGFFLCGDLGLQEAAEAARQAHDLEAQDDYAFSGMGP